MNIQILDSWLKEYLKTEAPAKKIAEALSLTSVSVERVEKWKNDHLYDIEITTNRPDLASVVGLAREAGAVLAEFDIKAEFIPPKLPLPQKPSGQKVPLTIINDSSLVNRITAVVLDVSVRKSPALIQDRLEATGIRSLNNIIDITNYVMRTIGHPTHVFDYDRLGGTSLKIRESKRGETIITLDGKQHSLPGGDIVAENENDEIVDLIGIMGLANSVVTDETKRIVFFIDNNEPHHIRKTSMALGIRTEAAQLNEKQIDPELALEALLYGISLYLEFADGKVVSDIIDIYPNQPKTKTVSVSEKQVQATIGAPVSLSEAAEILRRLGFPVGVSGEVLRAEVPSFRSADIGIPEDLIEEIARVYGYHNIPSRLPQATTLRAYNPEDSIFYWEKRAKEMLKYWGFTEVYTYSMVPEEIYEGRIESALALANPLSSDMAYMRRTLVPSLLAVMRENKQREDMRLFEIANIYEKQTGDLPRHLLRLGGLMAAPQINFQDGKGIIEQLARDFGIRQLQFVPLSAGGIGASVILEEQNCGNIEVFSDSVLDFELDFELLAKHATTRKAYQKVSKYPPIVEDIALKVPEDTSYEAIVSVIQRQSPLIRHLSLLDRYGDTRTFHLEYQSDEKNLTTEEVTAIREKIFQSLRSQLHIFPKK